jgi:23S rRNA (adenine2030-N6)-methyltransferase
VYPLGSAGEWGAGIQRLWPLAGTSTSTGLLERYASLVAGFSPSGATRPERYPGSPLIARALLRPQDRMVLHDLNPRSVGALQAALGNEPRAEVRQADGFEALPAAVAAAKGQRVIALVDPPYSQKAEWTATAQAVSAARQKASGAAIIVWYPIKALTRPRMLLASLVEGGAHGVLVELLSTPLRLKRDRLAGSGVALIGVPERAVAELCASLVRLGPAVMTHGEWSAQQIGF